MNTEIFSPIGYTGVVLLVCVPLLWLVHALIRPRKWLAHVAVAAAVVAVGLAELNSMMHVSRIEVDQAQVVQEQMAARDLARQQAEADRAKEAADVRFVEDAAGEQLDKAGLDDTDLAYLESLDEGTPQWKQQKQTRDASADEDDDLESLIGGTTDRDGVEVKGMEEASQREPIFLSEEDTLQAHRLDNANLTTTKIMLALAVLFVVVDYVRRLNVHREAYFPLPIPSAWADALTARPGVAAHPDNPRRSLQDELRFITRRGEVFLYITEDPSAAALADQPMPRLPGGKWPIRVIDLDQDSGLDDRFVFESLWFSRNSFILQDAARATRMLDGFAQWLAHRRESRAKTRRMVHLLWDLPMEVPQPTRQRLEALCQASGYMLVICRQPEPKEAAA